MADFASLLAAFGPHASLFLVAFFAASVLPFPSEPAIIAATRFIDPLSVLLISSIASTLAACTNYYIGLKGIHSAIAAREPEKEKQAELWFSKWGKPIMFFAPTVPMIGDALTIAAGALKMDFKLFLLLTLSGRLAKNAILILAGDAALKYLGI